MNTNNKQFRVTLNTKTNLFIVYQVDNTNVSASGVTIEKAIQELNKIPS